MDLVGDHIEGIARRVLAAGEGQEPHEAPPAELILRQVRGDGEEPGAYEPALSELALRAHRADEHVVAQVSGAFAISEQLHQKTHELLRMHRVQLLPVERAGRVTHCFLLI